MNDKHSTLDSPPQDLPTSDLVDAQRTLSADYP